MQSFIPWLGMILSSTIVVCLTHRAGLRLYAKAITITTVIGYGLVLMGCRPGWALVALSLLLMVVSGCLMCQHRVGSMSTPR
jgi:uncharacterized iron-regulated membrane protein